MRQAARSPLTSHQTLDVQTSPSGTLHGAGFVPGGSHLSESIPGKKKKCNPQRKPPPNTRNPGRMRNTRNSAIARSGVELGGSSRRMVMWVGPYPAASMPSFPGGRPSAAAASGDLSPAPPRMELPCSRRRQVCMWELNRNPGQVVQQRVYLDKILPGRQPGESFQRPKPLRFRSVPASLTFHFKQALNFQLKCCQTPL